MAFHNNYITHIDNMEIAKQFDRLFLVYGCRLRSRGNEFYLNVLLSLLFYLFNVNALYANLKQTVTIKLTFIRLIRIVYISCCMYNHFVVWFRKSQLKQLFKSIQAQIAQQFVSHVTRRWRYTLLVLLAFFLLDLVTDVGEFYLINRTSSVMNEIMHFDAVKSDVAAFAYHLLGTVYQDTWFFITFLQYNFLLYCLDKIHVSYFNYALKEEKSVVQLRLKWHEVLKTRQDIERLFAHLPCQFFMNVFARNLFYVTSLNDEKFKMNLLTVIVLYWLLSKTVYTFSILFTVDSVNSNLHEMYFNFKLDTMSHTQVDVLKQDIEQSLLCNFTGSGLFTLNKQLLLGFVSAIVTFSVLLIQLGG